ncbi:hypothetical protein ACPZ19_20675 [Amycolatopsis lurida]|uniref:hypothetical protein n=1 Tax=Amycolatopsis sp. YIM 10 TaxID=2653857 RepID=UPI0012900F98|nr:hypothetical protein [Amycolatopsis sp. YIM 10]QFU92941.1 hypothetical protein YIM_38940 [Amycolatopsis sp. YIM 10]
MRDTVQIHVSADLPIRARALTYANRVEVRFGKAFPVALLIDGDALDHFSAALAEARAGLEVVAARSEGGTDGDQ